MAETCLFAWLNPKQGFASDWWLSVTIVIILDKINQQSGIENMPFVNLHSHLCEGFFHLIDYQLLNSKLVSPVQNITQWNIGINNYTPVIICDNMTKDMVNMEIAHVFAAKTGQPFFTYTSMDKIDDSSIMNPTILQIIHSECTVHLTG